MNRSDVPFGGVERKGGVRDRVRVFFRADAHEGKQHELPTNSEFSDSIVGNGIRERVGFRFCRGLRLLPWLGWGLLLWLRLRRGLCGLRLGLLVRCGLRQ